MNEQYGNEEWYRTSFEFTAIGKALVALDGHCLDVNQALCDLLGYSKAELLELTVQEITHPDDLGADLKNVQQMLDGTLLHYQMEKRYIHKRGHEVSCLLCVSMAYDRQGNPLHFISEIQDITERTQAEEALSRGEKHLRNIMENVVDGIFVHDQQGHVLNVNQSACDSLGYSREALLELRVADFELDYEEKKIQDLWDKLTGGEIHTFCAEGHHQRKDGTIFPVEAHVSLMETEGQPLMVAIVRDISERKQTQQKLEQANDDLERRVFERTNELLKANQQLQTELAERKRTEGALQDAQSMLRLVIDHIPEGIFWKDKNGVYLGCNHRLARDANFSSPEEIVGKTDYEMHWSQYAAEHRKDDLHLMETGTQRIHTEENFVNAENRNVWVRSNKIPFYDINGHAIGVLGSYEDITLQKETEAAIRQARDDAERANRAKDEFLSRTSHELRTPLNAILGFAQILEMGELKSNQREGVSYILQAGEHLLELVDTLLDWEHVGRKEQLLDVEPVSLAETLQEVLVRTALGAQEKGIQIECDITRWTGLQVLADAQRLKQVLLNLISNAIKYNRAGGSVSLSHQILEGKFLKIEVIDTGIGIAPELMNQLFLPFERLGAEKLKIEGTGLGLTISKALVEAMHGRLEVKSELGQGSTFSVILPMPSL